MKPTPPRPPKAKPAKAVKARLLYTDALELEAGTATSISTSQRYCRDVPVFVLDGSLEAIEQMIAQGTVALMQADSCDHRQDACIVLRSIGLLVAPRDGKKKA